MTIDVSPPAAAKPPISLQTLNDTAEHSDVLDIVNTLLPKWVEGVADKYAPEYAELENTWHDLCKKIKTIKNKILCSGSYNGIR